MRAIGRAIIVLAFGGLLAACTSETPAPLGSGAVGALEPQPAAEPAVHYIIVQPGQSLGRIAEAYHVPERAIIAANGLTPPYKLKAGARLALPANAALQPVRATAALSPPERKSTPHPVHAAVATAKPPPHAKPRRTAPEVTSLDEPENKLAARHQAQPAVAASPTAATGPRQPRQEPEEIPLDDPPAGSSH